MPQDLSMSEEIPPSPPVPRRETKAGRPSFGRRPSLGRRTPTMRSMKRKVRGMVGKASSTSSKLRNEDDDSLVNEAQDYGTLSEQSGQSPEDLAASHHSRTSGSRSFLPPDDIRLLRRGEEKPEMDLTVQKMERVMRQIALIFAAYNFGAKRPEWQSTATTILGYVLTAWATCVVIMFLELKKQKPSNSSRLSQRQVPERMPLLPIAKRPESLQQDARESSKSVSVDGFLEEPTRQLSVSSTLEVVSNDDHAHPDLAPFYIMNGNSGERTNPNGVFTHLSNEWIEMDMLPMIRTPDVDDPTAPQGTPFNSKMSDYFKTRQRRFEFQFQFKLKKSVVGKSIYFACELEDPIKLGIVQRAFVGAAMAFMKKTNPSFHYSITGSPDRDGDGSCEKPHMAFTVLGSMDRVVISKPGETPPELGTELFEDPESIKSRKKGIPIDWNCDDTYTFALWSAYVDWIDWRVLNLPGIRPFDLSSILGNQSINVALYMIDQSCTTGKHFRKDLYSILDLEFSSMQHSTLGPMAQKWYSATQKKLLEKPSAISPPGMDAKVDEGDDANDDDETGAELGEGIYMRSGDGVILREAVLSNDEDQSTSSLAMGGGFAVLQEQDVSVIIQKARRSKRNRLIKSGDSVYVKLIQNKGTSTETRYLTIHRGWWLKWATSFPSKNGYFTIHPFESDVNGKAVRSSESESDYLTMGSSFYLRHKRWSRYHVGVAADPSPTYGGRMLALYNPKSTHGSPSNEEQYHPDDDEPNYTDDDMEMVKKNRAGWMKPIVLCAHEPNILTAPYALSPLKSVSIDEDTNGSIEDFPLEKLIFSRDHCQVDVPAWIETMNRTERIRQLTYVVRVTRSEEAKSEYMSDDDASDAGLGTTTKTFARLRTGRELARIMMVGKSVGETPTVASGNQYIHHKRKSTFDVDFRDDISLEEDLLDSDYEDGSSGEEMEVKLAESQDESYLDSDSENDSDEVEEPSRQRSRGGRVTRGKRLIGKVAKSAKSATKKTVVGTAKLTKNTAVGTGKLAAKTVYGTGKAAVGTGKLVAKGTKTAGKMASKAVIAPVSRRPKKPPKSEPKAKKKQGTMPRLELSKKTMKKIEKFEKKKNLSFLAGELCAPEQSCRIASRVLSRMSSVPYKSPAWGKFNDALVSQVAHEAEQDRWFLEGTAVQIGVTPLPGDRSRGNLLHECLGARCLWESHWREEWCGIYEAALSFYAPSTQSPCLEISFIDIRNIRPLDAGTLSPLPGFYLLVIETAWLCHYVAFRDEEARDTFGDMIEEAVDRHIKSVEGNASIEESDLRNARFWQGFQTRSNSSLSAGAGKWAKVSCGSKDSKERSILNGRRMAFDIDLDSLADGAYGYAFVEDLLTKALSFSLHKLEEEPDSFVEFLDLTSQLRLLPLEEIDLSSRHAFCLFANIYHCLLQQAMLLSLKGPLDKKSMNEFMRTSCYEIGNDVFSLSELYCCVLRGKMSKPSNLKAPYPEAPKKSSSYRFYALEYNDPRINFILSTGDSSCPRSVPVLKPQEVENHLGLAAGIFLKKELYIDVRSNAVILPKLCDVYKYDFGGDSSACLRFCLDEVDEDTAATIRAMMDSSNVAIRFQHNSEHYHSCLQLRVTFGDLRRTSSNNSIF